MTDSDEQAPKIIVDDDWKSQVQAEKEELKKKEAESADDATESSDPSAEMPQELPPASFDMLVTTMGAQAMSALGFMPDPSTGKANPNRTMAKHLIDTLGVLEEKTKGNLTQDEATFLNNTLHQLRMAFVTPPETQ